MSTVGDDPLKDAGKHVQQGSGTAGIYLELPAHIFGNTSAENNGHGVVGSGKVGQRNQRRDAHLRGSAAVHPFPQLFNQPYNAAVVGDQFGDAAAEQRQEKDLAHAGKAVPDGLSEGENRQVAVNDPNDPCGKNADGQGQKYIDSDDCQHKYQHIGENLDQLKGARLHNGRASPADQQQNHQRDEGGGQRDIEVDPEFVFQRNALRPGGSDGGVGDHGQVIAEHGAACTGAQHHGDAAPAFAGKAHGNGNQRRNGADRGAGCSSQKSGDQEYAGNEQLHRDDGQPQIHGGFHPAHGFGDRGESAGQNVDHQHGQHVFVGSAAGKYGEFFIQRFPPHAESGNDREEHCRHRGELVKGHPHTLRLKDQPRSQIDDDEQQERQ